MKKFFIISILIISALIGILMFNFNKSNGNNVIEIKEYYLFSNHTELFNDEEHLLSVCVPGFSFAIPFETEIDVIKNSKLVESVVPYYDLYIGYFGSPTRIEVSQGASAKTVELPLKEQKLLGGYGMEIELFKVISYYDQEAFKANTILSYEYLTDSGIYITEDVADVLCINKTKKLPKVKFEIYVPIKAKIVSESAFDGKDIYEIIDFKKVDIEVEVAGIISRADTFYGDANQNYKVIIPYQLSSTIYSQINYDDIHLNDNEVIWKPNTYIIKTKEKTDAQSLGVDLQQYIHDFVLVEHNYNYNDEMNNRIRFE